MTRVMSEVKLKRSVSGNNRATAAAGPLSGKELEQMHTYWRACLYLAAGMIYLRDNPLLRKPLKPEHIKQRLLGHWAPALV